MDTVTVLVRHLAATQIALVFNQIDRLIWGSQLTFLHFLNTSPTGATYEQAKIFYDKASVDYPDAYEGYSLENWLGFLRSCVLLLEKERILWITQRGRELLSYLAQQGRDIGWRPL